MSTNERPLTTTGVAVEFGKLLAAILGLVILETLHRRPISWPGWVVFVLSSLYLFLFPQATCRTYAREVKNVARGRVVLAIAAAVLMAGTLIARHYAAPMISMGLSGAMGAAIGAQGLFKSAVITAPGMTARRLLSVIYSRRTVANVFEPMIADMQAEWLDAMTANRAALARWIQARGCFHLGLAVLAQSGVQLVRLVVEVWRLTK